MISNYNLPNEYFTLYYYIFLVEHDIDINYLPPNIMIMTQSLPKLND